MAQHRRTSAGERLAALVAQQRAMLVTSALAGGLAQVRRRSSPSRIAWEADRFIRLLGRALVLDDDRKLDALVRAEVRLGALAVASPDESDAVLAVWRRALRASFLHVESDSRGRMQRVLADLSSRVEDAERRWAAERIDVIAIAASAGGIRALGDILSTLDEELPATVLIVQHIAKQAPSVLPAVLGRSTRLALAHAIDGAVMYLGCAYVAPGGTHLTVEGDRLRLVDSPPVHFAKPAADVLFESAGRECGVHLVSVVLSGSGRDGSDGTVAVHARGGITLAQDPTTAEFSSMPQAAVATDAVDGVFSLERLGALLHRLCVRGRGALSSLRSS